MLDFSDFYALKSVMKLVLQARGLWGKILALAANRYFLSLSAIAPTPKISASAGSS